MHQCAAANQLHASEHSHYNRARPLGSERGGEGRKEREGKRGRREARKRRREREREEGDREV